MSEPIRKLELPSGTRYRVVVDVGRKPDGKRAQRTATFHTRREARDWLAETRQACNAGTYVGPSKVTVAEHLDGWLGGRRRLRPATRRNYADALRPVRERLGWMPLQQLTRGDVEKVVSAMLDGSARRVGMKGRPLSPRSVNLTLTILTAALETAVPSARLPRRAGGTAPLPAWSVSESSCDAKEAVTGLVLLGL